VRARRIGLYYPYIHFRDMNWLKLAVLYWDGLERIVPTDYLPRDSPEVRELARCSDGFIHGHDPYDPVLERAARPFLAFLREADSRVLGRLRVSRSGDDVVLHDGVMTNTEILGPKMFHSLRDGLQDAGLAVVTTDPSGLDALVVHPRLADLYIGTLASEMARASNLHPVTDRPTDHLAMADLSVDSVATALTGVRPRSVTIDEAQSSMAVLSLRMVMPERLDEVSFEQLVAFKESHPEELSAYHDFVAELATPGGELDRLSTAEDPGEVQAHLEGLHKSTVAPKVERLERDLNGIGIATTASVATVTLTSLAALPSVGTGTLFGAAIAGPFAPAFAAAAIGLGIFTVARRAQRQAAARTEHAKVAYLMRAKEEFGTKPAMKRLATSARRFEIGR
jgi:hypothetical protein